MKNLKKVLALVLSVAIMVATFTSTTFAATTATITNNNNGTITVNYDYSYTNRVKVLVAKDGKTYQYELSTGNNSVVLPLTEGTGTYTVKVCKNVEGTKYSVVYSTTVTSNSTDNAKYLTASQIVNYKAEDAAIAKAAELCKDLTTDEEKITAIWTYIKSNYSYDYDKVKNLPANTTYVPSVEATFASQKGICYDISAVAASMLRSQGVPTKLVKGYTPKASTYHAWNQVYVNGTWKTMDITYDVQVKGASMYKDAANYSDVRYTY